MEETLTVEQMKKMISDLQISDQEKTRCFEEKTRCFEEKTRCFEKELKVANKELKVANEEFKVANEELKVANDRASFFQEEARVASISSIRANFNDLLNRGFESREEFIHHAREACFGEHVATKKSSDTDAFVNDDTRSNYSAKGVLDMSKVHRCHLAHGKDRMNVRYIQFPNLRGRAEQYFRSLGAAADFDDFITIECENVVVFQTALSWLRSNAAAYNEMTLQKAYILFIRGLFRAMNTTFGIFSVNSLHLEADIEVKRKGKALEEVKVRGKADCAFGPKSLQIPLEIGDLISYVTTLVELKVNQGPLDGTNSPVGKCTSQQLIEMFAFADMKKRADADCSIIKSLLTDFFNTRVAFRVEIDENPVTYFVSTLHDDAESFVLLTILMLSDIPDQDFVTLLADESVNQLKDNEGSEDEEDDEEEGDEDGDKIKSGAKKEELNLSSAFAEGSSESDKPDNSNGGGKGSGSSRALKPLSLRSMNVMTMGDDPVEEAERESYYKLALWEARLSFHDTENIENER